MARFKYMGEIANQFVQSYGPCLTIKIPNKNGSITTVNAPDQVNGFAINTDIGIEVTDERALRAMRADARFEEIV